MILRFSDSLAKKLKTRPTTLHPFHANSFADWTVHFIRANRAPHFLAINTRALYTIVVPAEGIVSPLTLEARIIAHLKDYLIGDGFEFFYRRLIEGDGKAALFSKPLNPASIATTDDLGEVAMYYLAEDGLSTEETANKMNTTPLSALDGKTPRRTFQTMGF